MDSASSISNAPTVTPGDSASQVAAAQGTAPSTKPRPKRSAKGNVDNNAPPGAVQVPAGKTAPGPGSKVTSATIPLSGWGNLDLAPFRKDIEPTFTVDARPFADMVDTTYQSIQARYTTGGKHIPRSLYRYYCYTMWWYRSLWLHKSNGKVLSTEQKNFLSVVGQQEELQVPSHVAQYLANMGNFTQGGETYLFNSAARQFVSEGTGTVNRGWLETGDRHNHVDDADFWTYAMIPVPAVVATTVTNEADFAVNGPGDNNLEVALPQASDGDVYPTENIIGWDNAPLPSAHSSWRATFAQLGWSLRTLPGDVQTQFLTSTSTLKWVSERLSTLKDFKVNSIKQLTLSNQGHSMQAYYLGTDTPASQRDQFPLPVDIGTARVCGSRYSDLSVKSRYAIDPKVLAPAFSFGYRIERTPIFLTYRDGQPVWANRSNYQPWVTVSHSGNYVGMSPRQVAGGNATFNYGSQGFLNVQRFSTHELNRSAGLDAALILSDAK